MEIQFRRFQSRHELAIYIRQADIFELTGLRGESAHFVMARAGWVHGVWTVAGSCRKFKGYRLALDLAVQP